MCINGKFIQILSFPLFLKARAEEGEEAAKLFLRSIKDQWRKNFEVHRAGGCCETRETSFFFACFSGGVRNVRESTRRSGRNRQQVHESKLTGLRGRVEERAGGLDCQK